MRLTSPLRLHRKQIRLADQRCGTWLSQRCRFHLRAVDAGAENATCVRLHTDPGIWLCKPSVVKRGWTRPSARGYRDVAAPEAKIAKNTRRRSSPGLPPGFSIELGYT